MAVEMSRDQPSVQLVTAARKRYQGHQDLTIPPKCPVGLMESGAEGGVYSTKTEKYGLAQIVQGGYP
ncbi:MAG: hypothetical protein EA370_03695 [Wenzhouxiangella sp.]|nr:MAG: hypothetical protein EA370_03695 [Wenzhouxiangella sp.]